MTVENVVYIDMIFRENLIGIRWEGKKEYCMASSPEIEEDNTKICKFLWHKSTMKVMESKYKLQRSWGFGERRGNCVLYLRITPKIIVKSAPTFCMSPNSEVNIIQDRDYTRNRMCFLIPNLMNWVKFANLNAFQVSLLGLWFSIFQRKSFW